MFIRNELQKILVSHRFFLLTLNYFFNCRPQRGDINIAFVLCLYSMRIQPKDYVKDILRCASGKGFNYDQVSGDEFSSLAAYFEIFSLGIRFSWLSVGRS